jgi:hypothetical protein
VDEARAAVAAAGSRNSSGGGGAASPMTVAIGRVDAPKLRATLMRLREGCFRALAAQGAGGGGSGGGGGGAGGGDGGAGGAPSRADLEAALRLPRGELEQWAALREARMGAGEEEDEEEEEEGA